MGKTGKLKEKARETKGENKGNRREKERERKEKVRRKQRKCEGGETIYVKNFHERKNIRNFAAALSIKQQFNKIQNNVFRSS